MLRKKRRKWRMTAAERAAALAQRRYWRWQEFYTATVNELIKSLGMGRKMTAAAMVKFAVEVADKVLAMDDKRRPVEVDNG